MSLKECVLKNRKIIINYIAFVLFIIFICYIFNPINTVEASTIQKEFDNAYNSLAKLTREITSFLLGISIISGVATMVYHLIRLGAAGSNPQARGKVLQDMFTTVICISLLGSFTIVVHIVTLLLRT